MASNMTSRVAVAVVAIPVVLGVIWLGGWPLTVLVGLMAVLGVRELFDLAEKVGLAPLRGAGLSAAALMPAVVYLIMTAPSYSDWLVAGWVQLAAVGVILLLMQAIHARPVAAKPLSAVAVTLFGVAYAAALPTFLIGIRHGGWPERSWSGAVLVFFPLVVTWVTDTAAMFGGKAIGGAKLAPTISPGKTRAGGIAGVLGGGVVGVTFALMVFPRVGIDLDLLPAVVIALVLATVGQMGDLAESLLKREAGVKDSSALIPGHGGVLDRLDSLYFVLPIAAACYRLVGLA
jgi:phosphatidate cytidylyltransferase